MEHFLTDRVVNEQFITDSIENKHLADKEQYQVLRNLQDSSSNALQSAKVLKKATRVSRAESEDDELTPMFRGSSDDVRPVESAFAASKRARNTEATAKDSSNVCESIDSEFIDDIEPETDKSVGSKGRSSAGSSTKARSNADSPKKVSVKDSATKITFSQSATTITSSVAKKSASLYRFRPPMNATIVRANLSDTRGSEERQSFAAELAKSANNLETMVEVEQQSNESSATAPLSSGSSSVVMLEASTGFSEPEQIVSAVVPSSSVENTAVAIVEEVEEVESESLAAKESGAMTGADEADQPEQRPVDIATPPLSDDGKQGAGREAANLDKNTVDLTQESENEDITSSQSAEVSPKRPGTVVLSRKMAKTIGKPAPTHQNQPTSNMASVISLGRKRRVQFTRFDDYIILCTMSNKQGHILSYQEYVSLLQNVLPQHSVSSIRNRIKELISNALLRQAAAIEDKSTARPLLREFGEKCAKEYERRYKKENQRLKDMFPAYQNPPILKVSRWVDFYRLDLISIDYDWSDFYTNDRVEAGLAQLNNELIHANPRPTSDGGQITPVEDISVSEEMPKRPDSTKSRGTMDDEDDDLFRDNLADLSATPVPKLQTLTNHGAGKLERSRSTESPIGKALESLPSVPTSQSNLVISTEISEGHPHTPLNQSTSANPWSSLAQKLGETPALQKVSAEKKARPLPISGKRAQHQMRKERALSSPEDDSSDEGMFRDDITKSVLNQEPAFLSKPAYRTPSPEITEFSRLKRKKESPPQLDKLQNETDNSYKLRAVAETFETAPEIEGTSKKLVEQPVGSSTSIWHIAGGSPEYSSVVDETRQMEEDEDAETDDQFEVANSESEEDTVRKPTVTITRKRAYGIHPSGKSLRQTLAQQRASSFAATKPPQTTLSSPFTYDGVNFGRIDSPQMEGNPAKRSRHSDTAFIKRRLLGSPTAKGSDNPVADALYQRLRNVPGGDKLPELVNKLVRLFPDANKLDHLEALYSTTFDLTNAVDILFALQDNTPVPSKKGIWTSNDDMVLMHGVGGRMASFMLGEKHGYDGVIKREEFLKAMETDSF